MERSLNTIRMKMLEVATELNFAYVNDEITTDEYHELNDSIFDMIKHIAVIERD